jgi:Arc/MetJ family transcription regulator
MITFDIKTPSVDDLMRAVMKDVEQKITDAAQVAAAPHGGVKIRFARDLEGNLMSVEFEGSEAAVEAAQAAVAD